MFNDKKIPYIKLIPIILLSFILLRVVNDIEVLTTSFSVFISYISSFIWAFGIAYLLNPIMVSIEKKFHTKRALTLLIIYVCVLGISFFSITILTPNIGVSIRELTDATPGYIAKTQIWVSNNMDKIQLLDKYGITKYLEETASTFMSNLTRYLNTGINFAFLTAVGFTSSFMKFLLGFVVSLYLLKDKEILILNIKRLIYAILKKENADSLLKFSKEANSIFSGFVIGKFIDSVIIGFICFVGLSILKMPYVALISLIVGVTNMIPYFGPLIGMVPAFFITLLDSPVKALWVLLFIIILQQFDGLYLGPKILGKSVGLSPLLIILSILIGGGTFGVLGMFLAVPTMAIVILLAERFINRRLKEKDIKL
ncbi:AI-2E family transporter [Clostridium sp. FP2]|uniref:AI-2E family transporter n=1 Tax=Clostridium TaxID=1485 RepID=UPI0013E9330E|nr:MULTISPECIES: AI-2E family transporter [Clostridium]MBU3127290.1 AI-2E family transporter [Clostridium tagluense]MBZ9621725.1 AI-2E family transporter [Clostridium sp. FP2]